MGKLNAGDGQNVPVRSRQSAIFSDFSDHSIEIANANVIGEPDSFVALYQRPPH